MAPKTSQTPEHQDAYFMELALRQAEIAVTEGQTPFRAVLVDRNGQLIGEGTTTCELASI